MHSTYDFLEAFLETAKILRYPPPLYSYTWELLGLRERQDA